MADVDLSQKNSAGAQKIVGADTNGVENTFVKSSANQDLAIMDLLDNAGVTGVIAIPANTATPIRVGASNLANRKRLLFIPTTGVSMFWSLSASLVGATNGMTVFKNQPVSDNWGPNTTVYIYSTAAGALAVTESA